MRPEVPRFKAQLADTATCFDVPMDTTILAAAEQAGVDLLSSCRNGTCRTCICVLAAGQIAYRIAWPGLSAEEKADGYILPCVAYPQSDLVLRAAIPSEDGTDGSERW